MRYLGDLRVFLWGSWGIRLRGSKVVLDGSEYIDYESKTFSDGLRVAADGGGLSVNWLK